MKLQKLLGLGLALSAVLTMSAYAEPYQWYEQEINLNQTGNGAVDFTNSEVRHYSHMRLHLVNPNETAMEVELPALERSYVVPAKSDRWVTFPMLEAGQHSQVSYNVNELKSEYPQVVVTGKTKEAEMVERITRDIAQSQAALQPYVQREETTWSRNASTQSNTERSTTVRGYW